MFSWYVDIISTKQEGTKTFWAAYICPAFYHPTNKTKLVHFLKWTSLIHIQQVFSKSIDNVMLVKITSYMRKKVFLFISLNVQIQYTNFVRCHFQKVPIMSFSTHWDKFLKKYIFEFDWRWRQPCRLYWEF